MANDDRKAQHCLRRLPIFAFFVRLFSMTSHFASIDG
jgi:hypothetical protein